MASGGSSSAERTFSPSLRTKRGRTLLSDEQMYTPILEAAIIELAAMNARASPLRLSWAGYAFTEARVEAAYASHAASPMRNLALVGLLAVGVVAAAIASSPLLPHPARLDPTLGAVLAVAAVSVTWAYSEAVIASRRLYFCALSACRERFVTATQHERRIEALTRQVSNLREEEETMYRLLFRGQTRVRSAYSAARSDFLLAAPEARSVTNSVVGSPELAIPLALSERKTDWDAARRAAMRIREPGYGLRDFYVDIRQAFPELQLYTVHHEEAPAGHTDISSGLTAEEEYLRTLGALFGVYWLARIGIDGERGFSFGVDDAWTPRMPPTPQQIADDARAAKQHAFFMEQEWRGLLQLLLDAQMLECKDFGETSTELASESSLSGASCSTTTPLTRVDSSTVSVNVERTVAMLALTAIHDVFKAEALLPRVRPEHSPFQGFVTDEVINDHDIAMYYVLDFFPDALPSFAGLSPRMQRSILFTQSKMSFNHGWLVQGEAPPSALFSKFKEVISAGDAEPADIAFYFVHWLTDLAGAVPSPLDGSEKLVLSFPQQVLGSFIRSFKVLSELATRSETEVLESYLERYWVENSMSMPLLSDCPTGDSAIALMRLVCQAQTVEKQTSVLSAWDRLSPDDRRVLSEEMCRTGIVGQEFSRSSPRQTGMGPAILVYYSPHLLRHLSPEYTVAALEVLAEVYRRGRQLWPLQTLKTGASGVGGDSGVRSVTIRVDQLKELDIEDIRAVYATGDSWLLCKRNMQEAVIECHPLDAMTSLISSSSGGVAVLKLWRRRLSRSSTASSVMSSAFASAPPSGVVPWRGHIPELQSNLESALEAHADEHTERGSYGHMRLNRGSRSASCQGSCSQSRESSRLGSREESFKYVEELRQTAYDASRDEALGEVNELSRQATSTDNLPTSPILGPFDSPAANAVALGAPYASLNRRSMNVLSHEDAPGRATAPSPLRLQRIPHTQGRKYSATGSGTPGCTGPSDAAGWKNRHGA